MKDGRISREIPLALIIEDDLSMRLAIQAALKKVGIDTVEAESGHQGIEIFKIKQPDLVLLDVVMPELNGYETCIELRKVSGSEYCQILMVTGLDDIDSVKLAFEVGANGFITKPINWIMLGQQSRYMLRAGRAFKALSRERSRLEKTQKIALLGDWEVVLDNGAFTCSDQVKVLLGLTECEGNLSYDTFFSTIVEKERFNIRTIVDNAVRQQEPFNVTYKIIQPDGEVKYILSQGEIVTDSTGPIALQGAIQDITKQKVAEEEIKKLAFYDGLTGLSNRLLFLNRMGQEIEAAKRNNSQFALLYLDLDQFKRINDTFGHNVGDILLINVAAALKKCIRGTDTASRLGCEENMPTIARLGGDEFTIVLSNINEAEHAAMVARRIINEIPKPHIIEGHEIKVTTSIGISIYPSDGIDGDVLLKNADTAMYQAKKSGRNNYQFYRSSLNEQAVERFAIERDIVRGLENGEFQLYFQPKYDVKSQKIIGAEALIRWFHPERGMISPAKFIPIAEESGHIVAINQWVVQTACSEWEKWCAEGLTPGVVAVNLSGYQFAQQKVLETIQLALDSSGLSPQFFEVEITENILMQHVGETTEILDQIKAMGVVVTLDDFGTGYSSLSYLTSFQVDTIKIDRSFVMDCINQPKNLIIIKAIIGMGHSLGMKIVAEGVETAEQLTIIRDLGVDDAQGYYFSRPVPGEEFVALLKSSCNQVEDSEI